MLAATIISHLNVRDQATDAVLQLSEKAQSLTGYIENKGLVFTNTDIEQQFMYRILDLSERMNESLDQLESERTLERIASGPLSLVQR